MNPIKAWLIHLIPLIITIVIIPEIPTWKAGIVGVLFCSGFLIGTRVREVK
jgi:hypothetical protein